MNAPRRVLPLAVLVLACVGFVSPGASRHTAPTTASAPAAPSAFVASASAPFVASASAPAVTPLDDLLPVAVLPATERASRIESRSFLSASLGRTMPYLVYLPPGYGDDPGRRYPTVYLLHGYGGSGRQWIDVGATVAADRLMGAGDIGSFLIVMPEGENAYWVDHANGGPKWGSFVAVDLVRQVESSYRVLTGRENRAIGGLSMGAHGALQLALNFPGTFSAVGARSLVLRRFGNAPDYFGNAAEYAKRDPMQLVKAKREVAKSLALWVDIGTLDPWEPLARQFDGELNALGIGHRWNEYPGGHSAAYWGANLADYLRFYDAAFNPRLSAAAASD